MAFAKYLVPALAVAGQVAAQFGGGASSCSAATTTVQNAGDASAIAGCSTFTGSIAIATGTSDNIDFGDLQAITGSLTAENAGSLAYLAGAGLDTIGDTFMLFNLTILTTLNFPRLTDVKTIDWNALPALQQLSFTSSVQQANSLSIQNTQLNSLDGINLQTVDSVLIANNNYLQTISMQLGNITTALTLEANGRNTTAEFPNLLWAYNMTFRNVSSVTIPSLATLNGSLGFYSDYMSSISGPNLTKIGGSLIFNDCPDLTNISFPSLTEIDGSLDVASNTELMQIDGFPQLQTIAGALAYDGQFTDAQLPKIMDIRGAFNISSSQDISSICSHFQPLSGQSNVIKGSYTCNSKLGNSTSSSSSSSSGTSSSSGSSSSSSPSSAAYAVQISGATGLLGVVAAIFGLL